jgi:acyl-CoA thioesterase I
MSKPLTRFHRRIAEKAADPSAAPVLIVAFGDSVTQGMTELGRQAPDAVYHARLKRMLEAAYPASTFSVINAGQSGQTAAGALASLERDVLRHQPDLTLIGFGLNDAWGGDAGLGPFGESIGTMLGRIARETQSDVAVLTPSFMNKADNPRVAPEHRGLVEAMANVMNSGMLARYAQAARAVARAHDAPLADVYAAWQALAESGIDTDAMLSNGLNHPAAEAHQITAKLIMAVIQEQ